MLPHGTVICSAALRSTQASLALYLQLRVVCTVSRKKLRKSRTHAPHFNRVFQITPAFSRVFEPRFSTGSIFIRQVILSAGKPYTLHTAGLNLPYL